MRFTIRILRLIACVVPVLQGGVRSGAGEPIPVNHHEPIILRVLNGKTGQPLVRSRLILLGGYTERDINHRLWREEAFTNTAGEARLPRGLANFPFLQVAVAKTKLCHGEPRGGLYLMGRIRSEGLSAPNHCGVVQVEEKPGVLTLFAKGKGDEAAEPSVPTGRVQGDEADLSTANSAAKPPGDVSYPTGNELRQLGEHSPVPPHASTAANQGTIDPMDTYEDMCLPE